MVLAKSTTWSNPKGVVFWAGAVAVKKMAANTKLMTAGPRVSRARKAGREAQAGIPPVGSSPVVREGAFAQIPPMLRALAFRAITMRRGFWAHKGVVGGFWGCKPGGFSLGCRP